MGLSGCRGEAGAGYSGQGGVTPALGASLELEPGEGVRSWAYKDPLGLAGLQFVVGGLRGRQDGEGAAGVPGARELPSTWQNPSLPGKNPGNIRRIGIRREDARGRLDGRLAGSPFPGLLPALMQQSWGGQLASCHPCPAHPTSLSPTPASISLPGPPLPEGGLHPKLQLPSLT